MLDRVVGGTYCDVRHNSRSYRRPTPRRKIHAAEHETERGRYDSAKLNEAVRSKQVVEAEHQGEGREEREQHQ